MIDLYWHWLYLTHLQPVSKPVYGLVDLIPFCLSLHLQLPSSAVHPQLVDGVSSCCTNCNTHQELLSLWPIWEGFQMFLNGCHFNIVSSKCVGFPLSFICNWKTNIAALYKLRMGYITLTDKLFIKQYIFTMVIQ